MSAWTDFRDSLRRWLRSTFDWYERVDPHESVEEPPPPPEDEPEQPEKPAGEYFTSMAGFPVPNKYINSSSTRCLYKRRSDTGDESVILLPPLYLGAITNAQIAGVRLRNTTRTVGSEPYPNGARVHLRAGKILSGTSRLTLLVMGTPYQSPMLDLNQDRLDGNWEIKPVIDSIPDEPEPEPEPPQEAPQSAQGATYRDGVVVLPPWLTATRIVAYTGRLGGEPKQAYGGGNSVLIGKHWDLLQVFGRDPNCITDWKRAGTGYRLHAAYEIRGAWPYPFERGRRAGEGDGGVKYVY